MTLVDHVSAIRDRITTGRMERSLLARPRDWNVLCSALDVLEDTELALDSYLSFQPQGEPGACYLLVYGALQALQTQQAAAEAVCTCLDVKPATPPKLPSIRQLRSDAVGHPMARTEEKVTKSSFIVRMSLTHHGFSLLTLSSSGGSHEQRHVDVPKLILQQRAALQSTLKEVVAAMDAEEAQHRAAHRDKKVSDAFPSVIGYYFEKAHEAVRRPDYFELGGPVLGFIAERVALFKTLLIERGEWDDHGFTALAFEELEYPLEELAKYFASAPDARLNSKDALIFLAYVRQGVDGLASVAAEIDDAYEHDPTHRHAG